MIGRFAIVLLPALVGLVAPSTAWALHDIAGRVEIASGNFVPPGTLARVALIITNHGPDTAPIVLAGTGYLTTLGHRTIELFPTDETPPCVVQYTDFSVPPPGISGLVASIKPFQELGPGESVTCIVGLITYPEAPATIFQEFGFGSIIDDSNLDNNTVIVPIHTRVAAVTVPSLSMLALLALASGLASFGFLALGKGEPK